MRLFLPNKYVTNIFEIEPQFIKSIYKRGVLVDLDNTLVAWDVPAATTEVKNWLRALQKEGINVIIFSNNNEERVARFAKPLNIPYIYRAKKPLQSAFKQAKNQLNLQREDMVVIGDQLLTDVLGGNRARFFTILVVPIVESDAPITKFNRRIERRILRYFFRKGMLERKVFKEETE